MHSMWHNCNQAERFVQLININPTKLLFRKTFLRQNKTFTFLLFCSDKLMSITIITHDTQHTSAAYILRAAEQHFEVYTGGTSNFDI